ncbi:hypothetical protein PybrP1_005372 [[Pythium] brassicae (nom. inval.)]|nr:hypothetical protein PybrP1_005372 [[Pythium] brassicae (nom. inval.)]
MTESDAAASEPAAAASGSRARGRYAKFTGSMDVKLLEAILQNNPFTAKHGTRLQMWQSVAEIVGEGLFKNPEAYSWHTCRDRVTALLKMHADGKHEKLFKQGTAEENTRKLEILSELSFAIGRKVKASTAYPGVDSSSVGALLDGSDGVASAGDAPRPRVKTEAPSLTGASPPAAASMVLVMPDLLKRRRLDTGSSVGAAATAPAADESHSTATASPQEPEPLAPPLDEPGALVPNGDGAGATTAHLDSAAFRARVLELIESKVAFDAEQRLKEAEQREQEIELQKRFLEYLQSK